MENARNPAVMEAAFAPEQRRGSGRVRRIEAPTEDLRGHLASVLQTTLDLQCLLELLTAEVRKLIRVDGVGYLFDSEEIELLQGRSARHAARYHLDLSGEDLGEIVFSRAYRFQEQELALLEQVLFGAVYAIRNCLHYRRAQRAAVLDPLTGLYNRAGLERLLEQEVARAQRYGGVLSMLILDLDEFKQINDEFGHHTGDQVLRAFARLLRRLKRKADSAFRYGGDEFILLLPNTSRDGAEVVAERIRAEMEMESVLSGDVRVRATVSVGLATLVGGESAEAFFRRADRALYEAKNGGRNRCSADERVGEPPRA